MNVNYILLLRNTSDFDRKEKRRNAPLLRDLQLSLEMGEMWREEREFIGTEEG